MIFSLLLYFFINSTYSLHPGPGLSPRELDEFMFLRNKSRDTKDCKINPQKKINDGTYHIKGIINYMEVGKGKYQYDVTVKNDSFHISTKIFLRNLNNPKKRHSADDYKKMMDYLKKAQEILNNNVPLKYNAKFEIIVTEKSEDAYFRPALITKFTRGPYYSGWSILWNEYIVAHELYHMFGVDDEYENSPFGPNASFCDPTSIMCTNAIGSIPKPYIYQIIIDRLFCD